MLKFQRELFTDDATVVPSGTKCVNGR
jgi:hypothetical protein